MALHEMEGDIPGGIGVRRMENFVIGCPHSAEKTDNAQKFVLGHDDLAGSGNVKVEQIEIRGLCQNENLGRAIRKRAG